MRDIFICHSSEDQAVANGLVKSLEARGIACWIAPRDIHPGADYAEAIVGGISEARALVMVFSRHANVSAHVGREVERAVSRNLPIVPYRIEDVEPTSSLAYLISSAQWVDGTAGDPAASASQLVRTIRALVYPQANDNPREATRGILRDLIQRYGTGLADDPRRLQALLRDVAGEHRAEVAVLVAAAEEGVGATLLQSSEGLTPQARERLVRRMQQNRALAEDAARWAVDSWAHGLGLAQPLSAGPDAVAEPIGVTPVEAGSRESPIQLPETVGMVVDAERLPAVARPATPAREVGRPKRMSVFVGSAAAVVLLIGGVAAWMATRGSPDVAAFSPNEVFLEPVGVVEHPFTSSLLATGTNPVTGPPTTQIAGDTISLVLVEGSHEMSYAADRGRSACDAALLLSDLNADPAAAGAWAEAQGIAATSVADFVAELTPAFLTQDARVTSHVLDQGQAVPRQALMQQGTAVLVGPTGEPRVRCASGSPLSLPAVTATPTYVGVAWPEFDPASVVEIEPCDEPITEFILQDVATGEPFVRQVGSDVTGDSEVTTTTIPPTTTTLAPTTTTTSSTTTTTTLPVADYDATGEGTVSASSRLCGSYAATRATDGNITTSWISGSADARSATFAWTGAGDEYIGGVAIISNAANATAGRRTNHGFASVTVQVLDGSGAVEYEEVVELVGTPDPDVLVHPNVVGRSVRLLLGGPENPSGSGFAELTVWVAR